MRYIVVGPRIISRCRLLRARSTRAVRTRRDNAREHLPEEGNLKPLENWGRGSGIYVEDDVWRGYMCVCVWIYVCSLVISRGACDKEVEGDYN